MTHSDTRGSRFRFLVLSAVSRVLTAIKPSASTPHATGDICGEPSRRQVVITALWCSRMKSRARSRSIELRVHRLEDRLGDVEVGVDVLHVVVLLERVDDAQHRLRLAG